MRTLAPLLLLLLVVPALGACASTYHPEYHPETSYSYVQNVIYAQNVWQSRAGGDPPAPDVEGRAPSEPALRLQPASKWHGPGEPSALTCTREMRLSKRQECGSVADEGTLWAADRVWQREGSDVPMTWGEARTYCAQLTLAGGRWRLPDEGELVTLYASSPIPTGAWNYWSRTAVADASNEARFVDFGRGYGHDAAVTDWHGVRCVR